MNDVDPGPEETRDELEQYAIVANRRQQWDTLLWQMPTMVLTGEAFLFTISLGAQIAPTGRVIAASLSLIVALASLHSLASHRLSELADSAWLHDYELAHGAPELHGLPWRDRRSRVIAAQLQSRSVTDRLISYSGVLRSIVVWFWTMTLIAVGAAVTLVLSVGWPQVLVR